LCVLNGLSPRIPRVTITLDPRRTVLDIIYIAITIAFFAVMLGYVRGCERLGRDVAGNEERTQ
jgi:hypothetical protein